MLCGICFFSLLAYSAVSVLKATVVDENGVSKQVVFPFYRSGEPQEQLVFKISHPVFLSSGALLHIVPDDCVKSLRINKVPYSLSEPEIAAHICSFYYGFTIDPLKQSTKNFGISESSIEVEVENRDGRIGLDIWLIPSKEILLALALVFILSLFSFTQIMQRWGFSSTEAILITLAFALRILYYSYTYYDIRSHDIESHIAYIRYLLAHYSVPDRTMGGAFYHPPFYYIIAAVIYKIAAVIGFPTMSALQLFSLLCSMAFIIVTAALFSLIFSDKKIRVLLLSLLAFWPAGIIHAPRISNDVLLYPLCAVSLLCIIKWQQKGGCWWLRCAMLSVSLATMTKGNGIAMWAVLIITWLYEYRYGAFNISRFKELHLNIFIAILLFTVSVIDGYGPNLFRKLSGGKHDWLQGETYSFNNRLSIPSSIIDYVTFDIGDFLQTPFANAWDNSKGRQYFWNYLLKTSLFGEFSFKGKWMEQLALTMSWLLLPLLLFMLGGAIFSANRKQTRVSLLLTLGAMTSLCIAYRFKFAISSAGDFRYVFPVLIPLLIFFGNAVLRLRASRLYLLEWTAYGLATANVCISIVFFMLAFISDGRLISW